MKFSVALFLKFKAMKKIFLSTLMIWGVCSLSQAQNQNYSVTDLDGVEYENNSVHLFSVHGTFADPIEEAKLHLRVNNKIAEDIYVSGEIVEIINTDGTLAQFCIGGPSGNCFFPLAEGAFYPNSTGGTVPANGNWGNFDYVINLDPTKPVEYKVRFTEFDSAGNEIPNTNFFITYRHDDAMGVSDVNSIAIAEVYPTVAKGSTTVQLKENANVQIFNLEGKAVKSLKLNSGKSNLDLSGLSSGVYLVQFKGTSGLTHTTKIVVK